MSDDTFEINPDKTVDYGELVNDEWHIAPSEAVFRTRPPLHNDLRRDAGMDPVDHCAECWAVLDDGTCPECGCDTAYEQSGDGGGDGSDG